MPRSSRLAIWCIALLLSLSLYFKGRVATVKGSSAALLRAKTGVMVRLAGDFPHPGLYTFPKGVSVQTAIKMTLPAAPIAAALGAPAAVPLSSGDIVTLKLNASQPAVFSLVKMGAKERMLLGIALDPDLMGAEEWRALPGIGPALSQRIYADRHKYGAFGSLDGLLRVPGIGNGKIDAIRRYF
jgi:competence protein ComEA